MGTTFAGYEILGVRDRDATGVVHRAREIGTGRPAALTLLAPGTEDDPDRPQRLLERARAAATVVHPHVLPVLAAGEEAGAAYVATRVVESESLAALVDREGPLPTGRASQITRQVAAALDATHAAGIVHGAVTPATVRVDATGHVFLVGFGPWEPSSDPGGPAAVPAFPAPEQARGERIDARTDVHALGGVLHHALTGSVPGPEASTGDPAVDLVLARALSEAPDGRFPSAGDLGRAALAAARGESALAGVRGRVVATGAAAAVDAGARPVPPAAPGADAPPAPPGALPGAPDADAPPAPSDALPGAPDADAPPATGAVPTADARAAIPPPDPTPEPGPAPPAVRPDDVTDPAGGAGGVGLPGIASGENGRSSRRGLQFLAAGLGIAALTGGLVLVDRATRGDDLPAPTTTTATRTTATAPPEPSVTATIRAGSRPNAIAAGSGRRVYVVSNPDEEMTVLDGATGEPVGRAPTVGAGAQSVDVGYDRVWVAKAGTGSLLRLSARTAQRAGEPLPLPEGLPVRVRAREGSVWVGLRDGPDGEGGSVVAKYDPSAGTLTQTVPIAEGVQDLDVGDGAVWVVNRSRPAVVRIDIATGERTTIPVGAGPRGIAVGGGSVWVAASEDGAITRFDARPPHRSTTIEVGTEPRGVAFGAGSVWVTNGGDGTVSRIDPGSGEVVGDPIEGVGTDPGAVSAGRDSVWVVATPDGTVARIDVPDA